MSKKEITVRLEMKNENIKEEFKRIVASVDGYNVCNSGSRGYFDLMIMEIGRDVNGEFELISSLKESGSVREVFLTSSDTNSHVLINALRAGAKEFFIQPLIEKEIITSLLKFRELMKDVHDNQGKVKKGKIVTVMGSKGGVGTTTVAVNLAASLNETKNVDSVVVIDMNLVFGAIPLFLDVKTSFNWGEVVKNISRVDATYLMSVLERHPSGVYVLPSPTELSGVNQATPENIEQLMNLIKNEFDYIVLDNGQSFNTISRKILEISDMVLVVSNLSLPCLINVKRILETFWNLGYPGEDMVKIVMNRYHKNSMLSLKEAEEGIGKQISWRIANDYDSTMSAINQGKVLSSVSKKTQISRNFKELALSLLSQDETNGDKKSH